MSSSLENMEGQKWLFEIVKAKISDNDKLVNVIKELLEVSTDSAYRRIRGEKELNFSELQKICRKFNLSMDNILNSKSKQNALFHYSAVDFSDTESYIIYMLRLLDRFTTLKSASNKEILYTGQDIPFYHFLEYPELYFLKLYAWNNTINSKPISFNSFCNTLEKDRIISIYEKIHNAYMTIPSKEIWTNQTIDTILKLMEHYYETGAFENKEIALLLLTQLTNLIDTVKNYADVGYKESDSKTQFSMYICSVDLENNYMLTRSENNIICYLKLYTINSISTDNEYLCSETAKWIDDLISKSTQISSASIKERLLFFNDQKNKIDVLKNKIELG